MKFLFAHGAGAGSGSSWMKHWAGQLATFGTVETFDYDYIRQGKKRPDPLTALIDAHRNALHRVRMGTKEPVVLAGKSMGSRVGCHLALEEHVSALLCFGYPLVSIGAKKTLRDEVLVQLRTPILFIQGTKDPLCPLDALSEVRSRMHAPNDLFVVNGGNHSLQISAKDQKAQSITHPQMETAILEAIARFLQKHGMAEEG